MHRPGETVRDQRERSVTPPPGEALHKVSPEPNGSRARKASRSFEALSVVVRSLPLVAIEGSRALGWKCLRSRSRLARLRNFAPFSERFARCALLRLRRDLVQSFPSWVRARRRRDRG